MFKMTAAGLVKRIRSGKGSVPSTDDRDGWFAHKVEGRVVHFHYIPADVAKAQGWNEVWAYVGTKFGPDFKEFRGAAEKVAEEILAAS